MRGRKARGSVLHELDEDRFETSVPSICIPQVPVPRATVGDERMRDLGGGRMLTPGAGPLVPPHGDTWYHSDRIRGESGGRLGSGQATRAQVLSAWKP